MKDTTFRPVEEQLARLSKSSKPDADKTGLEATTIIQLKDPLDGRERQPMPSGGRFSTAGDLARFAQTILNRGVSQGKWYPRRRRWRR